MKNKLAYETPELDIVTFASEDLLTSSVGGNGWSGDDDGEGF